MTWHTSAQGLPLRCTASVGGPGAATLRHDSAPSPIGPLFAAWHTDGLCMLAFAPDGAERALAAARVRWPRAEWTPEPGLAADTVRRIFDPRSTRRVDDAALPLLLCGTEFHVRVWRILLEVGHGHTVSYAALAALAGAPGAARAVGSAMARNPLVYVVPCHRVIRAGGDVGHYGGGAALKQRLLHAEAQRLPL